MQYFDVCKDIWTRFVPQRGQSAVLQGELLRQIEKLRHEAQANQNRNWCGDHAFFCAFLDHNLGEADCLSPQERQAVHGALVRLRSAGEIAWRYYRGELTDQALAEDYHGELAYPGDDLYDLVCDAVARLYLAAPDPIPYETRPDIRH